MGQIPKEIAEKLVDLNASYSFTHHTATPFRNKTTKEIEFDESTEGITAHIFDDSFQPPIEYVTHRGKGDSLKVLAEAVDLAFSAQKPMTPAQKASKAVLDSQLAAAQSKIAELEAKLKAASEPPFEGGKPTEPKGSTKTK